MLIIIMPGAAHIFISILIGILIYHISDRRFTPYHFIIWVVNNLMGPDMGWLFPNENLDNNSFLMFNSPLVYAFWR